MAGVEHRHQPPVFGEPEPHSKHQGTTFRSQPMFPDGSELPIFSGTPIPVIARPFVPQDQSMKQSMLPGMPAIDYDHVLANDQELRRRHHRQPELPPSGDIFQSVPPAEQPETLPTCTLPSEEPVDQKGKQAPRLPTEKDARRLREALVPYIDFPYFRELAAQGMDLRQAMYANGGVLPEVQPILELYQVLFHPKKREQIRSPADIAAVLMVEMGHLDQEELRTVLLDTKNRIQGIVTIYKGSLNSSMVRVGEVYKEALRRNSAGIIVVHNHPSGQPDPSPEDVLVTKEIVQAGHLLGVECLDHLVIGQGRWVSMKGRGLGFERAVADD